MSRKSLPQNMGYGTNNPASVAFRHLSLIGESNLSEKIFLVENKAKRIYKPIKIIEEEDAHLPPCNLIASAANQRPDDFNIFGH